jgi:para-nitrobenzyl esterase
VEPWADVKLATEFGVACPQLNDEDTSEDCLTLNVWAPHPNPENSPVMVWIHGGGFQNGSSRSVIYDGQALAEMTNTVVVSINYRLGPLGFLAHPALGEGSGNYGLLDQQAALRWVQDNIARFGGNPSNVTIFGESAGSASVCLHLVSPQSAGLFHKAIMQSGPCAEVLPDGLAAVVSSEEAERLGNRLSSVLGCEGDEDEAQCLRSQSVEGVLATLPVSPGEIVGPGIVWLPNVDGNTLTGQPLDLIESGTWNQVPIILGSNYNEGTMFVVAGGHTMTNLSWDEYENMIYERFGEKAPFVLAAYPRSVPWWMWPSLQLSNLLGDMAFVCPARRTARAAAASGAPVYLYQFTAVPSFSGLFQFMGSFHAAEIPFVFHTLPDGFSFDPGEALLSLQMVEFWTNFARYGNPNGEYGTRWPSYDETTDRHMKLSENGVVSERQLNKIKCDLWDSLRP